MDFLNNFALSSYGSLESCSKAFCTNQARRDSALHVRALLSDNPLTFAKVLVRKNLDDIACIQCVEYVKDEYIGNWGCELSRIQPDKFLKLKCRRKERKEYVINFNSCNVAVIRCWEREADITEVSL